MDGTNLSQAFQENNLASTASEFPWSIQSAIGSQIIHLNETKERANVFVHLMRVIN